MRYDDYNYVNTIPDSSFPEIPAATVIRHNLDSVIEVVTPNGHFLPLTDVEAMDLAAALVRAVHQ